MYCTKCGKDNPADAAFCGKCGAKLEAAPLPLPAPTVPPAPISVPPRLPWLGIGVITILLIGIILGVALLRGHEKNAPATVTGVSSISGTSTGGTSVPVSNGNTLSYTLTDLGKLQPVAINNQGQILVNTGGIGLWQNGSITNISNYFEQCFLNNRGSVVFLDWNGSHPMRLRTKLWQNGASTDLSQQPELRGFDDVYILGFNDNNQVLASGNSHGSFQTQTFIWQAGKVTSVSNTIHPVLNMNSSMANVINNRMALLGQISVVTAQAVMYHTALWQNEQPIDLGSLGGDSAPVAINDNNQIIGISALVHTNGLSGSLDMIAGSTQVYHAFLWQSGTMTDLGTLEGDPRSLAKGINIRGEVVGSSFDGAQLYYEGKHHAFLWQNNQMVDLNKLVSASDWNLEEATSINDKGQIIGMGMHNGQQSGYLLTPQ